VGKVHVKGLTVAEATELCQKRIGNFLKEATVSVKLVSFKITVLGSVNRPGYTFVQNPRCNILEGLGLGGDLTPVANRKRIKLFRQTTQGTEVVLLDLTSPDLLRSPYFYLQPNDVLYVEPLSGQTTRQNYTPVTVVLGIISGIATVILLYYTIKNNQK
jgi:polysaccharide export outer membrane protein